jgi:hypothetical protein
MFEGPYNIIFYSHISKWSAGSIRIGLVYLALYVWLLEGILINIYDLWTHYS